MGSDWSPDSGLYDALMYGGMIQRPLCIPRWLFTLLLTIFMPPLGVWKIQHKLGYPAPFKIFYTMILTGLFYVPGLLYGLSQFNTSELDKTN